VIGHRVEMIADLHRRHVPCDGQVVAARERT
jgi:phosphatidylserine decarboxylase